MDPDSNDGMEFEPEGEGSGRDGDDNRDDDTPHGSDRSAAEEAFLEYLRRRDLDRSLALEAFAAAECPELLEPLREMKAAYDELQMSQIDGGVDELLDEIDPGDADEEQARELARLESLDISSASRAPRELLQLIESLAMHRAPSRYTLHGELARGGMGIIERVWDESLRRLVARKVILPKDGAAATGVDGPPAWSPAVARFLDEALVTGQLDHPGIVPVHELGVDDLGRVYFTMKMVKGHDLAKLIELVHTGAEGWTTNKALGVLRRVCEAVAYAHSKGVIHRDIKPANIMVGRYGETYLMDWGLAAVAGSLRDEASEEWDELRHVPLPEEHPGPDARPDSWLFTTADGKVLGTPFYMSPEQARGDIENVDHRTDVYSLGAILYHLICGRMPYEEVLLEFGPVRGVVAMVLRANNLRPPRSLRSLAPEAPPTLIEICERAMARDRDDRYADADQVAEALGDYLEDISEAREEARRQARRAELINSFLVRMLSSSDPDNAQGKDVTVRDVLDEAAAGIAGAFDEAPLDEAALRRTIGNLYTQLGSYAEAYEHLSQAYELLVQQKGGDDAETLEVFVELSHPLRMHLGHDEAVPLLRGALTTMRSVLGADHAVTLQGEYYLAWALLATRDGAGEAEELFRALLERRLASETYDAAAIITLVSGLGQALTVSSRQDEAADLLLAHRDDLAEHLETSSAAFLKYDSTLSHTLIGEARYAEAESVARDLASRASAVLPELHETVVNARSNLGLALSKQGRHDEAEAIFGELVPVALRLKGKTHHGAACLHNRGQNLLEAERFDEALVELTRAVELAEEKLERGHPATARFRTTYGRCLRALGRDDEALRALHAAREALEASVPGDHDWLAEVRRELSRLEG